VRLLPGLICTLGATQSAAQSPPGKEKIVLLLCHRRLATLQAQSNCDLCLRLTRASLHPCAFLSRSNNLPLGFLDPAAPGFPPLIWNMPFYVFSTDLPFTRPQPHSPQFMVCVGPSISCSRCTLVDYGKSGSPSIEDCSPPSIILATAGQDLCNGSLSLLVDLTTIVLHINYYSAEALHLCSASSSRCLVYTLL
jgi:hypothetical protein